MMGSPTATWVSCAFIFETGVSGEKADKVVKTVIASVGTNLKVVVPEKKSECLLIALYAKPTESLKAWLWKQVLQMWEV
ncbi:hypothetical protein TSUD_199290 [Trifolium subterraneum]|uniref:Uncharacterized protein n=1 Tax=Trifolium subterraneum TaxID=3900 RepID=A0A2Z6MA83_TRISU|nr:hypothetical protein TSUD_199290 [Trifolium subterraneum]